MPSKLTKLTINLPPQKPHSYNIFVGNGLLGQIPQILKKFQQASTYVIITDKNVEKIYGQYLHQLLKNTGLQAKIIAFPAGEKFKSEATKTFLDHQMLKSGCGRDSMILALGGGVVGDTAGFVASTYMRGIPYIQIPTSLLAMVDSSIGGKVGIDTAYGKNLIGAFWHPQAVIADIDCLKNLPRKQMLNGLFEVIKIFLTYDAKYFHFIEKNLVRDKNFCSISNPSALKKIITRAIELKIDTVCRDEHDGNERMVLNWGHTIGHALERLTNYRLFHGFAVAYGILVESKISQLMGVLPVDQFHAIEKFMKKLDITANFLQKFKINDIVNVTRMDKKSSFGKVKYVLLEKIGKVKALHGNFGHVVSDAIVKKALHVL